MSSIARHHNEWLSLIEISGPFLSMPVLMRTFPQGLDALDRDGFTELRLAYEEWLDNRNSLRPTPGIHLTWIRYILEAVLGFNKRNIQENQAIPSHLKAFVAEHGETLRPDLVIASSDAASPLPRLLVQVVPESQALEKVLQDKRWKASPAMRMMELLRETGVPLGLLTNGEQWMLVNAPRGETSSFISWYAALWLEEPLTLRAFCSLLDAFRFFSVAEEDTLEAMLKESVNEQQEVTDQLGYQVRRAVEVLIRAVDKADEDRGRAILKDVRESELYEAALTVMMRLVFLLSAEERELLLLGEPLYDQNYAASTLRAQLREAADQQGEEVLERRFDAWCRLLATFRAVHGGIHHDRLNLPAYGGSLFDPQRFPFLEGRSIEEQGLPHPLPISNRTVLHLLDALQFLEVKVPGGGPAEARRLSFRALDVEQIGHVYEGLLDHVAIRAHEPVLGLEGTKNKEAEIPFSVLRSEEGKGEVHFLEYLHEKTGRSEKALGKELKAEVDAFTYQRLQIACNNEPHIFDQVMRYASLIRVDDFGYPAVFLPGSVYVTDGPTRRATGTHYTPRSLTEPIVQHTLEPLVYTGPAEGLPKEQWVLKSPAELLELKICDMAMGSAGFLVQVVRYLSERLVEAWEEISQEGTLQITPEGKPAAGRLDELIIPKDDEERLVLARRLVADRCIYGVDKNPLAVEIAKLSIWLTTMDKGRPFTFLDHALKCGDSLVGASEEDYLQWARSWHAPQATLFDKELKEQVELARSKRRELEAFDVRELRDAERKAELLKEADEALRHVKRGCDLLIGARLLGLKPKALDDLLINLLLPYMTGELDGEVDDHNHPDAAYALSAAWKEHAFHWPFVYPEIFDKGGFSALVSNPPFINGLRVSTTFGHFYYIFLRDTYPSSNGTADLCAFFLLRGFEVLRRNSSIGLIATNTIAQGDTRVTGLDEIVKNNGTIYSAIRTQTWPGAAAVSVSIVHIIKGRFDGSKYLNGEIVNTISSLLDEFNTIGNPNSLKSNMGKSFIGSFVLGMGFVMEPNEAGALLAKNSINKDVLFPYLNGEDLNSNPEQAPSRWVINFFDWPLEKAEEYPDCIKIIREKVMPERIRLKPNGEFALRKPLPQKWWIYAEKRPALYQSIAPLKQVLVLSNVTKWLAFSFVPKGFVLNVNLCVFAVDEYSWFSLLQNTLHESWARKYSSTLETRLKYSVADAFETYPFPKIKDSSDLSILGESYHEHRRQIMVARQEGLTSTYNRFHNSKEISADITHLRELHAEMDNAMGTAYGWNDLDLGHGFHETPQGIRFTVSEPARREVLSRLLQLNHERYEEEVKAGLHEKKKEKPAKEKKGKSVKKKPGQYGLF